MSESEDEEEWHELDQASVRKGLHDVIKGFPERYDLRMESLAALRKIVQQLVTSDASTFINLYLQAHPKDTRVAAAELAAEVNADLAALDLAILHPTASVPCRLAVSVTPPKNDQDSWLQLEPIVPGPGRISTRLPCAMPRLEIATISCPTIDEGRSPDR